MNSGPVPRRSVDRVGAKYFEKDLSKFQVQSQCTCTKYKYIALFPKILKYK